MFFLHVLSNLTVVKHQPTGLLHKNLCQEWYLWVTGKSTITWPTRPRIPIPDAIAALVSFKRLVILSSVRSWRHLPQLKFGLYKYSCSDFVFLYTTKFKSRHSITSQARVPCLLSRAQARKTQFIFHRTENGNFFVSNNFKKKKKKLVYG